jgi:uncharacterized protein YkwD
MNGARRALFAGLGVGSLALLALLASAAPLAAAGKASHAQAATGLEDTLREQVSALSGRILVRDPKADEVARWLAASVLQGPVGRGAVRHRMWREGIVDFEFSPISVVLPAGSSKSAPDAIAPLLQDPSMPWQRYNTLAVASSTQGAATAVAILLIRRVARIRSLPPSKDRSDGRLVTLPEGYTDPTLFITIPQGDVLSRAGEPRGRSTWELDAGFIGGGGTTLLELVAQGPRGPEVLALWQHSEKTAATSPLIQPQPARPRGKRKGSAPIAHNPYLRQGTPASTADAAQQRSPKPLPAPDVAAWVVGARPGPRRRPNPADVSVAEDHLWSLVQRTRESRDLLPLRRVGALVRAARRHAGDLGRGEEFGHETSSGNAMRRIEEQGVTPLRAVENVAVAANVAEAHAALMASPSHRANILDPGVSAGGVGVVLKRDSKGRWSAVVSELFAEILADGPGDQWSAAILNRINDRRVTSEIGRLNRRDKLDALALATSQQVIASGVSSLSAVERREIAEKARFHYLNVRRVGVDLLVTADPGGVDRIEHAIQSSFKEVGVGIVRLVAPMGSHAPGALVITLIFIERQ